MQELITRLMALGITEEQALQSIVVFKDFAKEKFPLFGGAIDKVFEKYGPQPDDFMP